MFGLLFLTLLFWSIAPDWVGVSFWHPNLLCCFVMMEHGVSFHFFNLSTVCLSLFFQPGDVSWLLLLNSAPSALDWILGHFSDAPVLMEA